MNAKANRDPKYGRLAVLCGVIATILLWPKELSWFSASAILLFGAFLFFLFLVEIGPWAYRWVNVGVAVPLSFLTTAYAAWSSGAELKNVLVIAVVLGSIFSAIAAFVAKRR